MGVSFAAIAYGEGDRVDVLRRRGDADPREVPRILYPRTRFRDAGATDLLAGGRPARGDLNVAAFDDGWMVVTRDAIKFLPEQLPRRYLQAALGRHVVLISQDSYYDIFAYGRWRDGRLARWLCVNPNGVVAQSGTPEPWETPFWLDRDRAGSDGTLGFHPLEMAGTASQILLGVLGEGPPVEAMHSPGSVCPIDEVMLCAFVKDSPLRSRPSARQVS